MMYITIAIYRQASMNIRIDVGQQQNWWWWGGVHKAKKILLHFSLNHGILSWMALFLEKLEFFFIFGLPPPPIGKFQLFFFEPFPDLYPINLDFVYYFDNFCTQCKSWKCSIEFHIIWGDFIHTMITGYHCNWKIQVFQCPNTTKPSPIPSSNLDWDNFNLSLSMPMTIWSANLNNGFMAVSSKVVLLCEKDLDFF